MLCILCKASNVHAAVVAVLPIRQRINTSRCLRQNSTRSLQQLVLQALSQRRLLNFQHHLQALYQYAVLSGCGLKALSVVLVLADPADVPATIAATHL